MLLITLIILFIFYTLLVITCPMITALDRLIINYVQDNLNIIPSWFPQAFDCFLYASAIIGLILASGIFLFFKKRYFDIIYISIIPLITYATGTILKHIVQRPRPPFEFFINVNPDGYSYVSNHTLISFCLLGIIICTFYKYLSNKNIKILICLLALFWVITIGFSRIWLGVHNPTDIIGAYLFGTILVIIFYKIRLFISKYIGL